MGEVGLVVVHQLGEDAKGNLVTRSVVGCDVVQHLLRGLWVEHGFDEVTKLAHVAAKLALRVAHDVYVIFRHLRVNH